jgi:hypothetical protein
LSILISIISTLKFSLDFGMMDKSAASATMPTTSITTIFIGSSIALSSSLNFVIPIFFFPVPTKYFFSFIVLVLIKSSNLNH